MNSLILKYYLTNRPLFLALIRYQELLHYGQYAHFKNNVLDFGCGDGFFMHVMKKFYPQIFKNNNFFALDVDDHSLLEAKKIDFYYQLKKYNGRKIPYPNSYFNSIISNCVFEHLINLDQNLEELYRVLKPGGKLFTTVMTDVWEKNLFLPKAFWRKVQKHEVLLSVEKWQALFKKKGFKVLLTKGYLSKKQSQLIEWLHFLSLPYLISYKIFNDWSKAGKIYEKFTPINMLMDNFSKHPKLSGAGGAFFVLQK